jgi:hypothetical protein
MVVFGLRHLHLGLLRFSVPSCVHEHNTAGGGGASRALSERRTNASTASLKDKYLIDVHTAPLDSNSIIDEVSIIECSHTY